MPNDARIYVTITVDMPRHPKLAALSAAQKWLIVEALCHCREHKTDGMIDPKTWGKIARKRDRDAILETGIAVEFRDGEIVSGPPETRHNRATIVTQFESNTGRTLAPDCVLILDYAEHQQLRREIDEIHEKRRSAGRKGGYARAANRAATSTKPLASAVAKAKQNASKTVAEKEEEKDISSSYVSSASLVSTASERDARGAEPDLDKPGKQVPLDGWKIINRPCAHLTQATQTALAIEASAMLKQGIEAAAILAGLEKWLTKSLGPTQLPHLVSDVIKDRERPIKSDAYLPPAQRPLTPREQAHIDLELKKDHPNPAVLRQFGIDPATHAKALPGAAA